VRGGFGVRRRGRASTGIPCAYGVQPNVMRVRVRTLLVLAVWISASCGDDGGTDAGAAGVAGVAGAAGVSGAGGVSAGTGGMSAVAGTGGRSGSGMLSSDICVRAPVDSCDLASVCASVKARRNCAGPIEFVACAPKQRACAQTASFCAKDASGTEWYFPTSCGKDQIEQGTWTIEAQCGCSESDAGADDAGL